jgi:hypothetical protein
MANNKAICYLAKNIILIIILVDQKRNKQQMDYLLLGWQDELGGCIYCFTYYHFQYAAVRGSYLLYKYSVL